MEKQSFLFFVIGFCLVNSCDNFRYDNLVFRTDSNKSPKGEQSSRKFKKQVEDVFDEFSRFPFRWMSSLPENSECRIHINNVQQEAERFTLWALKILDASAKLPSGILSGNLNQFGDFDECLSSKGDSNNQAIQGKYCLANIGIKFDKNRVPANIKDIDSAIHSNWILHSEFKDHGHRIPKFESFNVGICIPASCHTEEIETALSYHLDKISENSFARFEVSISDEVCYVEKENTFTPIKFFVWCIFILIATLIILGTWVEAYKYHINNSKITKILTCFSLQRNLALLLKTSSAKDEIGCIHGARFLNALALLMSHKQMAMLFSPIANRTQMSESFSKGWTMIGRAAILYTDSFVLFSGLLVSYSIIKDLDGKRIMNFKDKLINRIVRLVPNLFGVIFFCTYIMNDMGSGPQWGLVVNKYTNLCKEHMWRNFLFIHNYFGFENMCLTHTHQIGTDMQLFLVSPIFIYLIWKKPRIGILLAVVVAAVSTWLRYDITYRENLSTLLYYGISVERLWKTANNSYIMPTHRLTVYLTGVLLGYCLRRGGRNLKFSCPQATVGWILGIGAGVLALFGQYHAAYKEYDYDVDDAARFNAFAPILWTVFLSWSLFACVNGYGGVFNAFLSWKYFTVFTRISYALYLTQFPVFFYNVGTERVAKYYKGLHSLFDIQELAVIFIASIALTLAFDIPFQELKKILTERPESIKNGKAEKTCEQNQECRKQRGRRRLESFGT